MHNPKLYKQCNSLQRQFTQELLEELSAFLHLRTDGKDSLADIGCGTGDVLMDFVYPLLPTTFTKIVGLDISEEMIRHASEAYAAFDKVSFRVLDIGSAEMDFCEQFDHVTSFFCLQWVKNQRQALKNIYNLVQKDGDCFLVFPVSSPIFRLYETVAKLPKWSEFMQDFEKYIADSSKSLDPWMDLSQLLNECGFKNHTLEIRSSVFTYEGHESFRGFLRSLNPFIYRIPVHMREDYVEEMTKIWFDWGLYERSETSDEYSFNHPSKIAIVKATK